MSRSDEVVRMLDAVDDGARWVAFPDKREPLGGVIRTELRLTRDSERGSSAGRRPTSDHLRESIGPLLGDGHLHELGQEVLPSPADPDRVQLRHADQETAQMADEA